MITSDWTVEKSSQLYNFPGWGAGFFSVNSKGHAIVHPLGQPGPVIDIMEVVEEIRERKLGFPCVVRFQDILRARVRQLNEVFRAAIAQHSYKGAYYGVYPVKVNQMREVVEEIIDAGAPYHLGLEAGSKGELLIVLALNSDPEALTICNGYKDEEYLRLALMGRKLGRKVVVVIEKLSELPHLIRLAEEMNVSPLIGLRSKLSTKGTGKWESSSGDFAKFGLTTPELIQAVRLLKARGLESAAKLFHFHVGSQLTDIHTVKDVVNEGARIYAKLRKMGLGIEYFDVGGGLGVDYVGARSKEYVSSLNYTLDEYAADVVYSVQQICSNEGVPEPHLVSESGRALTAHHSCIIMNVFGSIEFGENGDSAADPTTPREPGSAASAAVAASGASAADGAASGSSGAGSASALAVVASPEAGHDRPGGNGGGGGGGSAASADPAPEAPIVREMREIVHGLTVKNSGETYHDAVAKKEQALTMFKLGILGLEERALVESLFWNLCRRLVDMNKRRKRAPGQTRDLGDKLADQYMANFSLFQSAPDHWAFGQLFPIAPIHRLDEPPSRDSTIVDITCDSDGKMDRFIENETVDETIALHPLRPGEPYYLALFLAGAYQDIMGDLHNLFGRVNEVHVFVDDEDPQDYYVEEVIPGDTVERVLARVQYEPSDLTKRVKQALDAKVREGQLKPKEGVSLAAAFEQAMRGYTYLANV